METDLFTCAVHGYSGTVPCPDCSGGEVPSRPEHVRPGNQPPKGK
jgi:hypothetical protein